MRYGILVCIFVLLILGTPPSRRGQVIRPVMASRAKVVLKKEKIPNGFIPLGPARPGVVIDAVPMKGRTLSQVKEEDPNTLAVVPPMYFNTRTGLLIGAAAYNGKIITTIPVDMLLPRGKSRTLVLIRRRHVDGLNDVYYIPPRLLRKRIRWLQGKTIEKLRINLSVFNVFTMDYDTCMFPASREERSGLAASHFGVIGFCRAQKTTFSRVKSDLAPYLGRNTIVLSGDGGDTIGDQYRRNPKFCLRVKRLASRTAKR